VDEKLQYQGSLARHFLISNAMLEDPNFNQTVVLLIEHNENGAFGLTINRPSQLKVKDILPSEFDDCYNKNFIYQGGPVGRNNLFYIYQSDSGPVDILEGEKTETVISPAGDESQKSQIPKHLEICPTVYLGTSYDLLKSKNDKIEKILFFLGYSGWGPLQLEYEMDRKSWVKMKAEKGFIFTQDPQEVWRNALGFKGGIYKFFAQHIDNPDLN